jgi:hypothetical protein
MRQKRTKKAHRGGFEASPNPSGDLLLKKVSKMGKEGKINWIVTAQARLTMTDRVLIVYGAMKAAKRCFDCALALTWACLVCIVYGWTK